MTQALAQVKFKMKKQLFKFKIKIIAKYNIKSMLKL